MTRGIFITGTDTAAGKTHVALTWVAMLREQGNKVGTMKPVATGCVRTPEGWRNDDALRLQQAASLPLSYEQVNPYAFAPAIAPHLAAQEAGAIISISHIGAVFDGIANQCDIVVVEGAGGWLVPLNERETMADLAHALNLPVLLVVGLRLGCINHALLTHCSILGHGVSCMGWVANFLDPDYQRAEETLMTLKARITSPFLGVLPWSPEGNLPASLYL